MHTINGCFKAWDFLRKIWCHSDEKHDHTARAVIAVTQLDIENWCLSFLVDGYYYCAKC